MITKFVDIIKAIISVIALDATYSVKFAYETIRGKTWEFDPNSDAVGCYETHRTGRILVSFEPVLDTMVFNEDAKRPTKYIMTIENARELYKRLKDNPQYWFALDLASFYSKKIA